MACLALPGLVLCRANPRSQMLHRPAVSIEALAMLPEAEFLAGLNPAEQQRASDPHERVLMRLEQERLLRIDAVGTSPPLVIDGLHRHHDPSVPGSDDSLPDLSRQAPKGLTSTHQAPIPMSCR